LDYNWSPDQNRLYESTLAFARDVIDTEIDNEALKHPFDLSLWTRCAEFGLLDIAVPPPTSETPAHDLVTSLRMMEAFGYGCRDNGLAMALSTQIWTVQLPIQHYGSDLQKQKFLGQLSRGELIGSHAITEPDVGSDAYSLQTLARKVPGGYRLTGEKRMITNAPRADVILAFATINPAVGAFGVTAFLVDTSETGCTITQPVEKMGLDSVVMGHVSLVDCFVPEENRLGPEGSGFALSTASLEFERTCILAPQLGAMQRQLDDAVRFARKRKQFGQSIGKFQSVSNRIAEMKLRLELARLLLYKVAWLKDSGKSIALESAMLKLYLSESFLDSSLDAIRIRGGSGYLTDTGVERDYRDAVGGVLYAGTSDIQRNIIARLLGL
jgi:alkylation response protein AidB-like acyl-CoA dehydrogenase